MKSKTLLLVAVVLMICVLGMAPGYACKTCGCQDSMHNAVASAESSASTKTWYNPISWFKKQPAPDHAHEHDH